MKNAYKCKEKKDMKACQVLANICVLHNYDKQNDACKIVEDFTDPLPTAPDASEYSIIF